MAWNPSPAGGGGLNPEFKTRTEAFEGCAKAQCAQGGFLEPMLYTGCAEVAESQLLAVRSVQPGQLHPVQDLMAQVEQAVEFGGAGGNVCLMGVQDNYKPWSRMNWRNGKCFLLDAAHWAARPQLIFDDYSFTKGEEQGTYIQALFDRDGAFIDGTKSELQRQFSGEEGFAGGEGNVPAIFTVVLNKKGAKSTAVSDDSYFVSRVQAALAQRDAMLAAKAASVSVSEGAQAAASPL